MKQAQKASFTSTPFITKEPTMKHLTTHNNWIIALRNGKLVAFDNKGGFIEALGSVIYAGGYAWMYVDGQLWSGALERHHTDAEKLAEKQEQVRRKYVEKLNKIHEKSTQQVVKSIEDRNKELAALGK
jgi:hypothetical protein